MTETFTQLLVPAVCLWWLHPSNMGHWWNQKRRENRSNCRETRPIATWSALGANPGLRGLKPTTDHLSFSYRASGICIFVFKNNWSANVRDTA